MHCTCEIKTNPGIQIVGFLNNLFVLLVEKDVFYIYIANIQTNFEKKNPKSTNFNCSFYVLSTIFWVILGQ